MAEDSNPPQLPLADAIHLLQTFRGADLTRTIYQIEQSLKGASTDSYPTVLMTSGAKAEVLGAAGLIKQLAGQINVVIHALGILLCLPHILRPGEIIDYVSLGAGNTGRSFDLETNSLLNNPVFSLSVSGMLGSCCVLRWRFWLFYLLTGPKSKLRFMCWP